MAGINMNVGYIKSIPGILKIVEFVLLLLAFSCVSDCCSGNVGGWGWGYHDSRISFFLAVAIIGWLIVIGLFVLHFLSLTANITQVNWKLVVLIVSAVFAVLLLISASLLADTAEELRPSFKSTHYLLKYLNKIWDTLVAGVVFGFFALIAFGIDAVVHLMEFMSSRGGGGQGAGDNPSNTQPA